MKERLRNGSLVYINTYDTQSLGTVQCNYPGYHVKLQGDERTLYFMDEEVYPKDEHDVIVDSPDIEYTLYGGADLRSVLYTFEVDTESTLYKFMSSRLKISPYTVTILKG